MGAVAPPGVDDDVVGDREQPASERGTGARGIRAKGRKAGECPGEDQGCGVGGGIGIRHPAAAVVEHDRGVPCVERGKGAGIGLGQLDGGEVGGGDPGGAFRRGCRSLRRRSVIADDGVDIGDAPSGAPCDLHGASSPLFGGRLPGRCSANVYVAGGGELRSRGGRFTGPANEAGSR